MSPRRFLFDVLPVLLAVVFLCRVAPGTETADTPESGRGAMDVARGVLRNMPVTPFGGGAYTLEYRLYTHPASNPDAPHDVLKITHDGTGNIAIIWQRADRKNDPQRVRKFWTDSKNLWFIENDGVGVHYDLKPFWDDMVSDEYAFAMADAAIAGKPDDNDQAFQTLAAVDAHAMILDLFKRGMLPVMIPDRKTAGDDTVTYIRSLPLFRDRTGAFDMTLIADARAEFLLSQWDPRSLSIGQEQDGVVVLADEVMTVRIDTKLGLPVKIERVGGKNGRLETCLMLTYVRQPDAAMLARPETPFRSEPLDYAVIARALHEFRVGMLNARIETFVAAAVRSGKKPASCVLSGPLEFLCETTVIRNAQAMEAPSVTIDAIVDDFNLAKPLLTQDRLARRFNLRARAEGFNFLGYHLLAKLAVNTYVDTQWRDAFWRRCAEQNMDAESVIALRAVLAREVSEMFAATVSDSADYERDGQALHDEILKAVHLPLRKKPAIKMDYLNFVAYQDLDDVQLAGQRKILAEIVKLVDVARVSSGDSRAERIRAGRDALVVEADRRADRFVGMLTAHLPDIDVLSRERLEQAIRYTEKKYGVMPSRLPAPEKKPVSRFFESRWNIEVLFPWSVWVQLNMIRTRAMIDAAILVRYSDHPAQAAELFEIFDHGQKSWQKIYTMATDRWKSGVEDALSRIFP